MQLVLEKRAERSALAAVASPLVAIGFSLLTMAVMYVLLNLMIDILYGVIDPRVRLEGSVLSLRLPNLSHLRARQRASPPCSSAAGA